MEVTVHLRSLPILSNFGHTQSSVDSPPEGVADARETSPGVGASTGHRPPEAGWGGCDSAAGWRRALADRGVPARPGTGPRHRARVGGAQSRGGREVCAQTPHQTPRAPPARRRVVQPPRASASSSEPDVSQRPRGPLTMSLLMRLAQECWAVASQGLGARTADREPPWDWPLRASLGAARRSSVSTGFPRSLLGLLPERPKPKRNAAPAPAKCLGVCGNFHCPGASVATLAGDTARTRTKL